MGSGFLIVIVLIFAAMYFLMIRPQKAQQRKHQDMLANLKVGDEVITVGGIYGDVVGVEPDRVSLEIAEDVEIEVARRGIASVVVPEEAEEQAEPEVEAEAEADAVPEEPEPVVEVEKAEAESAAEQAEPEPEEARR
ncbi:MAG TPA: preprotein translocase subunit YajC [Gaiellaceae bacterium]